MSALIAAFQQIRGYPLLIFCIALTGWGLTNLDQSLFGYAIPGITSEFGVGLDAISWILSASFILAAFSTVVVGIYADRYGRRAAFVFCLAISALLVGLQAFATSLVMLGILRTLAFGISNGLFPLTTTYTVEAAPPKYRGLMTGLLQSGYPIGWFVASMLAVPLMGAYGWRAIFLPAFLVIPLAFVIARFLPESRRFEKEQVPNGDPEPWTKKIADLYKPGLRHRTILGAVAYFAYGGAYSGTAFYFPTFYNEFRGYTPEDATFIVGLSYGIGLVGYIASASVGEFFLTRRNTIVIWVWTGALALTGLIWIPTTFVEDILWFGFMATFFYGSSAVLATFITEIFPTRLRATGAAMSASLGINLSFATYPVMVAWAIEQWGWQWAFTWAVVPSLFVCGLAVLGIENIKSGLDLDDISE